MDDPTGQALSFLGNHIEKELICLPKKYFEFNYYKMLPSRLSNKSVFFLLEIYLSRIVWLYSVLIKYLIIQSKKSADCVNVTNILLLLVYPKLTQLLF